jgi:hypothetical protein
VTIRARWGHAKSSLGDAESSLGDAESSLGDAESSLGDAKSSLGDAKSLLGDAKGSLGARQELAWVSPFSAPRLSRASLNPPPRVKTSLCLAYAAAAFLLLRHTCPLASS